MIGSSPDPSVGIFWGVELRGVRSLLIDATSLSQAETYGECLTHPAGHSDVWERWRSEPLEPELSALVRNGDYDDYPRGRVVYQIVEAVFWIYADRTLLGKDSIEHIAGAFGIATSRYIVRTDAHYRLTGR